MTPAQQNELVASLAGWQYDHTSRVWLRKSQGALEERTSLPNFSLNAPIYQIESSMDRPTRTQYETTLCRMIGLRSHFFYLHCSAEMKVSAICEMMKGKQ